MSTPFEKKLLVAQKFLESTEEGSRFRLMLYDRYADMAEAVDSDVTKIGLIRGNKKTFNLIINENIINLILMLKSYGEYEKVSALRPELANMLKSEARTRLVIDNVTRECGLTPCDTSVQTLIEGFQSFNPDREIPEPMDSIETLEDEADVVLEGVTGINLDDCGVEFIEDDDDSDDFDELESEPLVEVTSERDSDVTETIASETIDESSFVSKENPELTTSVNRVMEIYQDLFEVGFELNKPAGVLVKEGMLKLDGTTTKLVRSDSLAAVYEIINDICGKYLVQSEIKSARSPEKLRELTLRKGTTYYPEFQLGTMLGKIGSSNIESWDDAMELIRKEVYQNVKRTFEQGGDENIIIGALTTAIVVSELDPNKVFKFRYYIGGGYANAVKFEKAYNERKQQVFKGGGKLYLVNQLSSGVVEVTMVFNMKAYQTAPLFAYKAVQLLKDRGKPLGIQNMIIGQDTSGRIKTLNLDSQAASMVLLAAGQRSGKGVLTLNLVGTILASQCPLVYLDCKPDMAPIFWDLARKHGVKAAVWDGVTTTGYPVGLNAPQECFDKFPGLMTKIPYLKVLQLMIVQTHLMCSGQYKSPNRPFYIFDEILACQDTLRSSWEKMVEYADQKKDRTEINEWSEVVKSWGHEVSNELSGAVNSQLPMSGLTTIWLFQSMQKAVWKSKETTKDKFNPFYDLIDSRLSTKFLGRGTYDSQNALLEIKKEKDIKTMIENRHFALATSQRINSRDDIEIFKPYLVLNYADTDATCVKELKSQLEASTPGTWEYLTNGTGMLDPGAGFEGFANIIGEGAIRNLELGYNMLWELMQVTGLARKYKSVEDYIFNAAADSFYSVAALKRGIFNERTVSAPEDADDIDNGESYSVDIDDDDFDNEDNDSYYTPETPMGAGVGTAGTYASAAGMGSATVGGVVQGIGRVLKTDEMMDDTFKREQRAFGSMQDFDEEDVDVELGEVGEEGEQLDFSDIDIDETKNDPRVLEDIKQFSAMSSAGRGGRRVILDSSQIKEPAAILNKDNSIDCRKAGVGELSPFEELMLSTPRGAARYTKKLWRSILSEILSSGLRAPNVTRLSIYGGNMYVNGDIVNLNGVIGGRENIRIVDIIDFKSTFKKFPRLRDFRIDEQILNAAMLELGDNTVERIFSLNASLSKLYITSADGYTQIITSNDLRNSQMQKKLEDMKLKNNIDTYCRAKTNKGWSSNPVGQEIWGMKVAKNSMSRAGEAFMNSNRPRLGTAMLYAGTSVIAGTVGLVGYGIVRGIGGLRDLLSLTR